MYYTTLCNYFYCFFINAFSPSSNVAAHSSCCLYFSHSNYIQISLKDKFPVKINPIHTGQKLSDRNYITRKDEWWFFIACFVYIIMATYTHVRRKDNKTNTYWMKVLPQQTHMESSISRMRLAWTFERCVKVQSSFWNYCIQGRVRFVTKAFNTTRFTS